MSLLGGFGRSARTRGWAVLDGLRSKELIVFYHLYWVLLPFARFGSTYKNKLLNPSQNSSYL